MSTPDYYQATPDKPPKRRKRRRIGMWVFLAVQALFVAWIITAGVSTNNAVHACHGASQGCTGATEAGSAIGIGLVILFWAIIDVILSATFMVIKFARHNA